MRKPSNPAIILWVSISVALLCPTVQSSESARVIYDQLERIQDDTKALHETRAPSWVDAPNMRGTSSILYSCILTLFACVYTALHLNIPKHSSLFRLFLTKLKWVAMALFAPEIVLWVAADQFFQARGLSRELRSKAGAVSGSKVGRFRRVWQVMTCSGGKDRWDGELETPPGLDSRDDSDSAFDLKYGFFVVMGGLEVTTVNIAVTTKLNTTAYRYLILPGVSTREARRNLQSLVDAKAFIRLPDGVETTAEMEELRVINWPHAPVVTSRILSATGVKALADQDVDFVRVPRSLIIDRSKADNLQKALILFQVGWMALQCAARKFYGLPLCLLELHTMVHVVCAILMYTFWLEKPLDLRSAERLQAPLTARYHLGPDDFYVDRGNIPDFDSSWLYKLNIIKVYEYVLERVSLSLVALILPILYGGIHLSAWNFEFPTATEALAWKVACIIIASALPVVSVVFLLGRLVADTAFGENALVVLCTWILLISMTLLLLCVTAARVFIVVEAFISLRSVPIGVYWTPSWIQMIPHV
ncbi:hypothetical protein QBC44DRAFT_402415 [Cladorrhinum sp. PSN332]|nr:hypothetical protein QBC44DRAFT_402415 [Cladorrhinum sp. PSN332]